MRKRWLPIVLVLTTLTFLLCVIPASAAPSESGGVHIVQRGETLYSIARRYGVNVWTLARDNGITNPNRIYVGQRIYLPKAAPSQQPTGNVHVVQPGETLYSIARRYGVSVWAMARANGIANLNYIYAGQRLTIPGAAPPAPTPAPSPQEPPRKPISLPDSFPGPWSGEYFNNTSLSDTACASRTDDAINFNWGYDRPAPCVSSNNFSVRWTGTFDFEAGTYNFHAKVDDGVRVYVDDERIINGWRNGSLRLYSAEKELTAGEHTVRVEYYDYIQVARSYFWWEKVTDADSTPTPPTPVPDTGWSAEFYNNTELTGDPAMTRHDGWIGFDWGTGSPSPDAVRSDYFSARWSQVLHLNTDHYNFCARSDDGVRIWVDGEVILDEWHPSNGATYCATHWVESGNHDVKVEYYEDGGNALIYMWWDPN
jgi:LysM repeat protein